MLRRQATGQEVVVAVASLRSASTAGRGTEASAEAAIAAGLLALRVVRVKR